MIIRTLPNGDFDFGNNTGSFISNNNGIIINTAVSLEDYTVTDDAGEGFDITIDVTLKKWVGYGTQTIKLDSDNKVAASTSQARVDTKQAAKSYTVKSGDTLYNICRAELGDGTKYKEIAKLNNIANPDKITIGQTIRLS
jgi:LysM repeat protein